jgi:hypothetical protein
MSTQMCVDLCFRALAEQNNNPTLVKLRKLRSKLNQCAEKMSLGQQAKLRRK